MPKCQTFRSGIFFVIVKYVIQSEAKDLEYTNVDVNEILPPFGRLNDNREKYKQ